MKSLWILILASVAPLYGQDTEKPTKPDESRLARSMAASSSVSTKSSKRGGGLAPTTWAITFMYSGTLYGSGYRAGDTDRTIRGTNLMAAYSVAYTILTTDLRAVYAFDVASLAGLPGPIWSSFMFNTRERPTPGTQGLFELEAIQMISDGKTHSIVGIQLSRLANVEHLDLYDAEEFENANPFAHPELAFTGVNPLIGTVPVSDEVETEFNIDVTAAVNEDLAPTVPTLGEIGKVALLLLLGLGGLYFICRRRPETMQ